MGHGASLTGVGISGLQFSPYFSAIAALLRLGICRMCKFPVLAVSSFDDFLFPFRKGHAGSDKSRLTSSSWSPARTLLLLLLFDQPPRPHWFLQRQRCHQLILARAASTVIINSVATTLAGQSMEFATSVCKVHLYWDSILSPARRCSLALPALEAASSAVVARALPSSPG